MTPSPDFALLWRDMTVGLALPDRAFGAAVDVDGLLSEPELHFTATALSSRLLLMPRAGSFARLSLEWETLPEIGVFTAAQAFLSDPYDEPELGRLEIWLRDVASVLHASRDLIRQTSERVVRDAARGLDSSLPDQAPPRTHVVSAHVGTRVSGPELGATHGFVEIAARRGTEDHSIGTHPDLPVTPTTTDVMDFTDGDTGILLGRRITRHHPGSTVDVTFERLGTDVSESDLVGWFDQHICREVLFDDVWQVCVHLVAGLEPPGNVEYFSG